MTRVYVVPTAAGRNASHDWTGHMAAQNRLQEPGLNANCAATLDLEQKPCKLVGSC